MDDKDIVLDGLKTNDKHINAALDELGIPLKDGLATLTAWGRVSLLIERERKLRELIESIEAVIAEDMGEWHSVEFAHLPVDLANRAHIRDMINDCNDTE